MDDEERTARFVSEPIEPAGEFVASAALSSGEPPLPRRFLRGSTDIVVAELVRTWRSTKNDRGDDYLARHWYEIQTADGEVAVIYFDRKARRGSPRWWLFSLRRSQR